jgi:ABC-type multidrug transport system fused ATPase/permease subunit
MNLNAQLLDSDILVHRTSMAIWMWFGNSNCFNVQALSFISCTIMLFHSSSATQGSADAIWKSMVLQRIWDLHHCLWGLLHQSSDIERRMVKVLKCFQTLEIPQERSDAKTVLTEEQLKSWPSTGNLVYDDVHLRYRPDCDLVLKGVSFNIKGGEKVGIVGRTGAGKSTLIQCISRLVEIEHGTMTIDGVNTSDLPLDQLRDAITVIPQDPTLFAGSVRFNLDPMDKHSDEEMLSLLKRAGLEKILNREKTSAEDERGKRRKKVVYDDSDSQSQSSSSESEEEDDDDLKKEKRSGPLDMAIQEGGENLSSGEKQLLCICRAALRKRKIIVLDEATANIDLITEQKIQKFMAEEFKEQTMLVIAHRLQTIIESDKVMVLGGGKVMEFDTPDQLLENEKSHFTKLVKQLTKKAAEREKSEKGSEKKAKEDEKKEE